MTNKEWQEIIDRTVRSIQQISATKGREYTRDSDDGLDNFIRIGKAVDLPPITAWFVLFSKHIDSIATFARDRTHGRTDRMLSEPIEGRIDDAIVYLLLLKGIIARDVVNTSNEESSSREA